MQFDTSMNSKDKFQSVISHKMLYFLTHKYNPKYYFFD